ncbi:peptide deformylase [Chryseomicrobium palamuruense]|uniref:Peptide deformylase n=1 Tax=Chryseomicrobium palamuruense TaxID=682973 RepID=A0ABV8UT60_9BACL
MIKMKDIIRDGHPGLRSVASEVPFPLSKEDATLAKDLLEYVKNSQNPELSLEYDLRPGIGIAAPQVNKPKRIFALHLEEDGSKLSEIFINPKIKSHSVEKTYITAGEGCLSVDEVIEGYVPRYARITISAQNIDGEDFTMRLKGLKAIAFQHELDHLNGIMFYDHINKNDPFSPIPNAIPYERAPRMDAES